MQDNREIHNMTLLLRPPFNPDPYFNLKPCYLQSEGILLNQGRNSVPQYLKHKISSNYHSNKHSSSEGTQEKRER